MTETTPTETERFVLEVTDRDFEREVERSSRPTVVVFSSEGCQHCRAILPAIEGFARELRDRVRFVVLDVVANPWTTERFGIQGTPTLKFFCRGRPVQEIVGALPAEMLRRQIEEFEARGEECIRSSTEIDYEITGYG